MTGILFGEPRLASIYDALHTDRRDLDPYLAIGESLAPRSVIDLGCGTGTFACLIAQRGVSVIGVDPAAASIDVARRKPGGDQVRWIIGDSTTMPADRVDMVTMTGNVGEHLNDDEWLATLHACRRALQPDGHLVFGARDPAGETWRQWNRDSTFEQVDIPGVGIVESRLELTDTGPRHFSFRWTFAFKADGATFDWEATFRVRTRDELVDALQTCDFEVTDVKEDDFVFIARPNDPA